MPNVGESAPSVAAFDGTVLVYDGVGIVRRGDALLICYQKPARLLRTRWIFDVLDDTLLHGPASVRVLLLVLPTADPPDAPTRRENAERLKKIGAKVRRLVTVPLGDAFWMTVVRTVMRGLNVLGGYSRTRFVSSTIDEGLPLLLQDVTDKTPSRAQILADLRALFDALGERLPATMGPLPRHDAASP